MSYIRIISKIPSDVNSKHTLLLLPENISIQVELTQPITLLNNKINYIYWFVTDPIRSIQKWVGYLKVGENRLKNASKDCLRRSIEIVVKEPVKMIKDIDYFDILLKTQLAHKSTDFSDYYGPISLPMCAQVPVIVLANIAYHTTFEDPRGQVEAVKFCFDSNNLSLLVGLLTSQSRLFPYQADLDEDGIEIEQYASPLWFPSQRCAADCEDSSLYVLSLICAINNLSQIFTNHNYTACFVFGKICEDDQGHAYVILIDTRYLDGIILHDYNPCILLESTASFDGLYTKELLNKYSDDISSIYSNHKQYNTVSVLLAPDFHGKLTHFIFKDIRVQAIDLFMNKQNLGIEILHQFTPSPELFNCHLLPKNVIKV
jgi:hypothetical protein